MSTTEDAKNAEIYRWFHEYPKQAPAIAALTLYLLVGIAILVCTIRTRAWFMLTISITAFLEFAGYATRVQMLHNPSMSPYVVSQALLIISPVLLSIVNYIAAGRILRYVDTSMGWLRPAWVAWVFTASDILCLLLQGSGGGMSASVDANSRTLGKNLLLIGLAIQLFFFTLFTCMTLYIHRCKLYGLRNDQRFRPVFTCLYCTIGLMYIRNIFRFVEFTQGYLGYLATNEVYFYIFDFALIFSCFLFYLRYHFGYYLNPTRLQQPGATLELDQIPASLDIRAKAGDSAGSSTTELVPHGASSGQSKVASWV